MALLAITLDGYIARSDGVIPLFTAPVPGPLELVESTRYSGGAIRLTYDLAER